MKTEAPRMTLAHSVALRQLMAFNHISDYLPPRNRWEALCREVEQLVQSHLDTPPSPTKEVIRELVTELLAAIAEYQHARPNDNAVWWEREAGARKAALLSAIDSLIDSASYLDTPGVRVPVSEIAPVVMAEAVEAATRIKETAVADYPRLNPWDIAVVARFILLIDSATPMKPVAMSAEHVEYLSDLLFSEHGEDRIVCREILELARSLELGEAVVVAKDEIALVRNRASLIIPSGSDRIDARAQHILDITAGWFSSSPGCEAWLFCEEDVAWLRALAGNHTIDFAELPKWATSLADRIEGWLSRGAP